MARVNLLMVDDVGLGKTIEAGLVAQELLLRHRARRIVVCPASLKLKCGTRWPRSSGWSFTCSTLVARPAGQPVHHAPRAVISLPLLRTRASSGCSTRYSPRTLAIPASSTW
jgi:hypothetical protein